MSPLWLEASQAVLASAEEWRSGPAVLCRHQLKPTGSPEFAEEVCFISAYGASSSEVSVHVGAEVTSQLDRHCAVLPISFVVRHKHSDGTISVQS